jgi:hypothetical protein
MFIASGNEGTGRSEAQQALRKVVIHVVLACAQLLVPMCADAQNAQQLQFTVTWVDWSESARARQRQAYRAEAATHEVLFCVDKWHTEPPDASGYRRIVIERTRRLVSGERHRIADVGPKCRDERGAALPTIHTHSDGNCQMSPSDLVAIASRRAPFDGIQCGDKYFVWAFAWQINAMTSWVYLSKPATQRSTSTH